MTGRAGRARHPQRAIVGTVACALLLAGSGTVFGIRQYSTELGSDCAAAVSAADQAVDDYVDAVAATKPILEKADRTEGYRDSPGASDLIAVVSGADHQVRMDLTCTSHDQLEALRDSTSELNTKKDALVTDSLHLTVSISSYNNSAAANELSAEIKAAQSVYDGSASQLPEEGVRDELKRKIDEATALRDAAPGIREQATTDNDAVPVDASTQAMGAKRIELTTKRNDTERAAGVASQESAGRSSEAQTAQAPETTSPSEESTGSGGTGSASGGTTADPSSSLSPDVYDPDPDDEGDDGDDDDDGEDDDYPWPDYRPPHCDHHGPHCDWHWDRYYRSFRWSCY
ncbi:hypothetical protein [uncultured Propionibacterium sp.]|uniref:hypothetical protein n=1 Tax=uncultured Propionibacterium sp. TaxID=218066 RepID=UPI00292F78AE|nr:hypothetical protein [uncultured Propionibacterium sp.]